MTQDDRTPVLVGIAQVEQRINNSSEGKEPVFLMVDAVRKAIEDSGSEALLRHIESIRVIRGIWRYTNPAAVVVQQLGLDGVQTGLTPLGGNQVQSALNQSALEIVAGEHQCIVLTGAECGNRQGKANKEGVKLQWTPTSGTPDWFLGKEFPMFGEAERARGIGTPVQMYPMFDNALRYARGETIDQHVRRVSELCAGFSRVAAGNPHAWMKVAKSAEEIRSAHAGNRQVSFPYTKLMNSNNRVDQGAALILMSVALARKLGIAEEKWVYPLAGTDAHDHIDVSHRDNLYSSPAIRFAGRKVLELADKNLNDIHHFDIYSCFPSAVQVAARELGVDQSRPLTVTGGLTFGGGPLNNYVMHGIARMAEVLREHRGELGMVTGNGGYLAKHAIGLYSTEPPAKGFRHANVQQQVDVMPRRKALVDFKGDVQVETYTVMYGPDGPTMGHTACLTADGKRTWANTSDKDVINAMPREEFCGRLGHIDGEGNISF